MYKFKREKFQVRVYTQHYRIEGTIHLPLGSSTADVLNLQNKALLPLTEVTIFPTAGAGAKAAERTPWQLEFFAVTKLQVLWVVGGRPSHPKTTLSVGRRDMAFLFPNHVLSGSLEVPHGARISDYLSATKPFQTLFDVTVYPLSQPDAFAGVRADQSLEFVTVNLKGMYGVLEAPEADGDGPRLNLFG